MTKQPDGERRVHDRWQHGDHDERQRELRAERELGRRCQLPSWVGGADDGGGEDRADGDVHRRAGDRDLQQQLRYRGVDEREHEHQPDGERRVHDRREHGDDDERQRELRPSASWDADANYLSALLTQTTIAAKAAPVLTWPTPAAIAYGTCSQ